VEQTELLVETQLLALIYLLMEETQDLVGMQQQIKLAGMGAVFYLLVLIQKVIQKYRWNLLVNLVEALEEMAQAFHLDLVAGLVEG
jgi:hypothetical protein